MGELFKKPSRVRKAAQRGKEITIPPEADLKIGDEVLLFSNGFVLIVPKGTKVNEKLLERAIQVIKVDEETEIIEENNVSKEPQRMETISP